MRRYDDVAATIVVEITRADIDSATEPVSKRHHPTHQLKPFINGVIGKGAHVRSKVTAFVWRSHEIAHTVTIQVSGHPLHTHAQGFTVGEKVADEIHARCRRTGIAEHAYMGATLALRRDDQIIFTITGNIGRDYAHASVELLGVGKEFREEHKFLCVLIIAIDANMGT